MDMSGIVISVDMVYGGNGEDSAILTKVVNAEQKDITELYKKFCETNAYDITKKSHIESAAVPFIKSHEILLP